MPIYAGAAGARLNGSESGNSLMYGSSGNDQFYPESGGNIINGNTGYNGVFYSGMSSEYTITPLDGVTNIVGPGNTNDILANIEYLQFNNESIAISE